MKLLFRVAALDELPAGRPVSLTVNGVRLIVSEMDGEWHAVAGTCTHQNRPLRADCLVNGCLVCPFHGGMFDAVTGIPRRHPARKALEVLPVIRVGDELFIEVEDQSVETATASRPPTEEVPVP